MKVKVSPINSSVVFAEGIVGSLVSTSRALIRRASIIGASIIGTSRALIANSNIAIKHSNSTSPLVDSRRYSSFSCFLSSFR